jgi:hypothetical protein
MKKNTVRTFLKYNTKIVEIDKIDIPNAYFITTVFAILDAKSDVVFLCGKHFHGGFFLLRRGLIAT